MAVESAADRASFLDPDEHGTTAQVDGKDQVDGIFQQPYLEVLGEEGQAGIGTRAPQFTFAEAAAERIKEGDTLRMSDQVDGAPKFQSASYKVAGPPEPDGTGMVVVQLQKQ